MPNNSFRRGGANHHFLTLQNGRCTAATIKLFSSNQGAQLARGSDGPFLDFKDHRFNDHRQRSSSAPDSIIRTVTVFSAIRWRDKSYVLPYKR